jgi:hypothetical protein
MHALDENGRNLFDLAAFLGRADVMDCLPPRAVASPAASSDSDNTNISGVSSSGTEVDIFFGLKVASQSTHDAASSPSNHVSAPSSNISNSSSSMSIITNSSSGSSSSTSGGGGTSRWVAIVSSSGEFLTDALGRVVVHATSQQAAQWACSMCPPGDDALVGGPTVSRTPVQLHVDDVQICEVMQSKWLEMSTQYVTIEATAADYKPVTQK